MSVEASKWARLADVQKSSSKLVLLNLAQLVRYNAEEWTVFASIEYLAMVTHLNRKTVIEALGRLRDLGAIQDTGRRAGGNRSSIIYRLCPNAVPLIDVAESGTVASGTTVRQAPQQDFEFEPDACTLQVRAAPADTLAHGHRTTVTVQDVRGSNRADSPENDARGSDSGAVRHYELSPADASTCVVDGEAHDCGYAIGGASAQEWSATCLTASGQTDPAADHDERRHRNAARRRAVGVALASAAPTRLPSGWRLPDRWQIWTQRERPLWSAEKIDAMAATFSAYMRSRPGEEGLSADWFESWRLWVFRERESKEARESAKPWHGSWSGIVTKGKRLGVEQAPNEPEVQFKARVFAAAGLPPPH